jgi:hypothetical protein
MTTVSNENWASCQVRVSGRCGGRLFWDVLDLAWGKKTLPGPGNTADNPFFPEARTSASMTAKGETLQYRSSRAVTVHLASTHHSLRTPTARR